MRIYVVSRVYTDNTSIIMNSFVYKDEAEDYVNKKLRLIEDNGGVFDEDDDCQIDHFEITSSRLNGMDE